MVKQTFTTSAAKPIWIITWKDGIKERLQRVAAYGLPEVLSFFKEEYHKDIIKIEKTSDEVTYHY